MRLGLAFVGLVLTLPLAADDAKGHWLTDYEEAKARAKQTGKPIFLVFR